MKYDARACHFNMDTGCVELLLRDGRKISIDCTGVEEALDVTMAQRTELDYLIYNDPLAYAELILNGNPKEYLKTQPEATDWKIKGKKIRGVPKRTHPGKKHLCKAGRSLLWERPAIFMRQQARLVVLPALSAISRIHAGLPRC